MKGTILIKNVGASLFLGALSLLVFFGATARGESCTTSTCPAFANCSETDPGACHTNNLCDGNCPTADCQDVSFDQSGTQFCCIVAETDCAANAPELPANVGPSWLALSALLLVFVFRKWKLGRV